MKGRKLLVGAALLAAAVAAARPPKPVVRLSAADVDSFPVSLVEGSTWPDGTHAKVTRISGCGNGGILNLGVYDGWLGSAGHAFGGGERRPRGRWSPRLSG